jgi:hypothetical protein
VKAAEDDVVCNPGKEKPTSPVGAAKGKDSSDYREKPDEENQAQSRVERTLRTEFESVVYQSESAGRDEDTADDDNR